MNNIYAILETAVPTLPQVKAAFIDSKRAAIRNESGISLYIKGVLFPESYQQIRAEIEKTQGPIILDIDSPGGSVSGCFELCDYLEKISASRSIYAVSAGVCASAAYAIASCARAMYISRSAVVGSVGVLAIHVDQSRMNAEIGLTISVVYAGAKKNQLSPHFPLSSQARADMQRIVDADYSVFCNLIAKQRGISVQEVQNTEAGIFYGQEAVKNCFADAVIDVNDIYSVIDGNPLIPAKKQPQMNFIEVAQERQKQQGISLECAMSQIAREQPELYDSLLKKE